MGPPDWGPPLGRGLGGGGTQQLNIRGDARVVVVTAIVTSVAPAPILSVILVAWVLVVPGASLVTMALCIGTLRMTAASLAGCRFSLLTPSDTSLLLGVDTGVISSLQVGCRPGNGEGLLSDEGSQLVIVLDGEIMAVDGCHLRKDGHILGGQGGAIGA